MDEPQLHCSHPVSKVVKVPTKDTDTKTDKFSHLHNDPDFKLFLKEMVDERIAGSSKEKGRGQSSQSKDRRRGSSSAVRNEKGSNLDLELSDQIVEKHTLKPSAIKSPSDTTIYSPGLRKMSNEDVSLIKKISQFVESIRIDSSGKGKGINDIIELTMQDQEHQPILLVPVLLGVLNVTIRIRTMKLMDPAQGADGLPHRLQIMRKLQTSCWSKQKSLGQRWKSQKVTLLTYFSLMTMRN